MTATTEARPSAAPVDPSGPGDRTERAPSRRPTRRPRAPRPRGGVGARIALTAVLLGALVLGFLAYLFAFSSVSMQRQQTNLRKTFQEQLMNAQAPVGPTTPGNPVAAIDIPALGIRTMIVVEGTSSRQLMSGPGHLPATVLPGQAGTSIVYGKRATFGAPFAKLASLRVGDRITVTTGTGVASYEVTSFGDVTRPPPANSANRLVLLTAGATEWSPTTIAVSADLRSTPVPSAGGSAAVADNQLPGARDIGSSLVPLAGWSQLLLLTAIVGTVGLLRWPRWPTVLCLGPVLVAVLWSVFENAAGMLPNVL